MLVVSHAESLSILELSWRRKGIGSAFATWRGDGGVKFDSRVNVGLLRVSSRQVNPSGAAGCVSGVCENMKSLYDWTSVYNGRSRSNSVYGGGMSCGVSSSCRSLSGEMLRRTSGGGPESAG